MTYCVGLVIDAGLVLMSDTRTNSGVDNISVFRKMFHWQVPGERMITVMTAGNLATTQAVIGELEERTKAPSERENALFESPTMFKVAQQIGALLRETIAQRQEANGVRGKGRFTASIILAGQIAGMEPRLFMIYPEGNFIEASRDTPFFQIGETKYGRPILIRAYDRSDERTRRDQAADGQFRFHPQGQPFGRLASRPHGHRTRRVRAEPPSPHRARRPLFSNAQRGMGGRVEARVPHAARL